MLLDVLLTPAIGEAQPMELFFAGEVQLSTEVLLPPFDGVRAGDPFWGRILFDSDTPEWCTANPKSCGPAAGGIYPGASMTVAVGGVEFTWRSVSIGVYNDGVGISPEDLISFRGSEYLEGVSSLLRGGILLVDFTGSTIDSGRMPTTFELGEWSLKQLIVDWSETPQTLGEEVRLSGELTSLLLRPVPEPSLAGLLVLSVAGLLAARAARWSCPCRALRRSTCWRGRSGRRCVRARERRRDQARAGAAGRAADRDPGRGSAGGSRSV